MLKEIETLLRIQHHDQKIRALEKELAGIPREAEEIKDKLQADQEAVEAAKHQYQLTEVAIKNLEIDTQTRKESITRLKVQQYETKKNEEFTRIGEEIERYGREIAELEDRELELMETADTQKTSLQAAREKLAESEKNVAEELEDLQALQKQLENEKNSEQEARQKLEAPVDETLLDTYRRLIKSKNGFAVAGLVDEVCQGCHMKVTKSTVVNVKAEKQLAYCENCGRILYWWTDASVGKNRGEY